jgi:hypothetical protein
MSRRVYFALSFTLVAVLGVVMAMNWWMLADRLDDPWAVIVRVSTVVPALIALGAALMVPIAWTTRYRE